MSVQKSLSFLHEDFRTKIIGVKMPDYWDIDEILSTDESIDCIFSRSAVGLGHLDPLRASTGSRDVRYFILVCSKLSASSRKSPELASLDDQSSS